MSESDTTARRPDEAGSTLIDEIIRMSDFTFDRLPMLDIIGDRMVENLSVALPDLMRAMCEASLASLDYIPMGKVIEGLPKPTFLAVGTGHPFVGEILVVMDQAVLMTAVELMLGGNARNVDLDNTDPFTAIELGFGERLASAVFAELERSLSVVGAANLELDRIETEAEGATIAKNTSLCARLRLSLTLAGNTGNLDLVIPYDALEQILPDLGKVYFGDRMVSQDQWRGLIGAQIERANVDLDVVLSENVFPLQKIMSWRPGDTIDFGIEEGRDATVTCADTPMFNVSLGKRNNGYVAVQITEKLEILEDHEDDGNDN